MAATLVPYTRIPNVMIDASPSLTNLLLDAASEKAAFITMIRKGGTISKVAWRTGTVTTGATMDVRIETVDPTTGDPTGTLWAANTNGSQIVADADDATVFTTTLTAGAVVAQGDVLAVVIVNPSVSPGNLNVSSVGGVLAYNYPYLDLFTTVWNPQTGGACLALEYSDVTYEPMPRMLPCTAFQTTAYNSGSTPDERALKFKYPVPITVSGFWIFGSHATSSDFDAVLYDSNGTTALLTQSVEAMQQRSTSVGLVDYFFDSTQALLKDTFYRLSFKPTTVNNITINSFTAFNAAVMNQIEGGENFHLSERTDAGAWTDTTSQRLFVGLIVEKLDNAVGGASGMLHHPGMTGNMNG